MTAFLIDIDTLKKLGYIQGNVEATLIRTTLRRVQDVMLLPIIGTTFFKRLLEGVNNNDLNADETTLLNEYIAPVLVSACDFKIVRPLVWETRSKTVGPNRDEYMTAGTSDELNELRNEYRADFEVYKNRLIGYLCDNSTLFPEYEDYTTNKEDIKPDKGSTYTPIRFA